jgi:hypothetical protein
VRPTARYELPPDREAVARRAARLEWWTLAYLATVVVLLYFVLGSSQAMRTC